MGIESKSQPVDDIFFIFVQVTVRNSDGDLVTYMESNKLFGVDKKIINDSFDHFSSDIKIPIFELNDTKFQVYLSYKQPQNLILILCMQMHTIM